MTAYSHPHLPDGLENLRTSAGLVIPAPRLRHSPIGSSTLTWAQRL